MRNSFKRNRTAIAILIAFVLTVGVTALWSAQGDELEGDTASNVVATAGAETGTDICRAPAAGALQISTLTIRCL